MDFDFEIRYKPGASNRVADALLRQPGPNSELSIVVTTGGIHWEEVQTAIQHDPLILKIQEDIAAGRPLLKDYQMD